MVTWILLLTLQILPQGQMLPDGVKIVDTGEYFYLKNTFFPEVEIGPSVGEILNFHYFPGMKYYQGGRYASAWNELSYFVERPTFTNGNPNQANYLSTAHYARGMIFLYHATGV